MPSTNSWSLVVPDTRVATSYRTRLEALFAAEATVAVILRRGPKKFYRLIRWDLETDTLDHGSG